MNYAKDYAEKVVAGKIIAGKKVILAAERYLTDLKKADNDDFEYFYDNERANKGIQFMEILPDPKTMRAYPLADFQRFIIANMYGLAVSCVSTYRRLPWPPARSMAMHSFLRWNKLNSPSIFSFRYRLF